MAAFPNLRAVATCSATTPRAAVIAANAGHADAADATKKTIAGHAITTLLPKTTFAMAMQRGARAKIAGKAVVDPAFEKAVTNARWEALYPQALLDEVPKDERRLLETHDAARQMYTATIATGPQPLAIEGTTFASSHLYEHDDESAPSAWAPSSRPSNHWRTYPRTSPRVQDPRRGRDWEHAFYNSVVESSFSPKHGYPPAGPCAA